MQILLLNLSDNIQALYIKHDYITFTFLAKLGYFCSVLVWFLPGPYDKFCPSPSFYNPIPWKPIHTPPPEKSKIVVSCTKSQKKQNPSTAIRLRNYSTAVELVPWRWHSRLRPMTVIQKLSDDLKLSSSRQLLNRDCAESYKCLCSLRWLRSLRLATISVLVCVFFCTAFLL